MSMGCIRTYPVSCTALLTFNVHAWVAYHFTTLFSNTDLTFVRIGRGRGGNKSGGLPPTPYGSASGARYSPYMASIRYCTLQHNVKALAKQNHSGKQFPMSISGMFLFTERHKTTVLQSKRLDFQQNCIQEDNF